MSVAWWCNCRAAVCISACNARLTLLKDAIVCVCVHVRIAVTASGVVLAAGASGVQRSTDAGFTWQRTLIPESPDHEATCMCAAPKSDTVYVIMEGLLYKTVDGGVKWERLGRLPPLGISASNIMAFNDEQHGFIGHETSNIYYTCDGGVTWEIRLPTKAPFRFVPGLLSASGTVPQ